MEVPRVTKGFGGKETIRDLGRDEGKTEVRVQEEI